MQTLTSTSLTIPELARRLRATGRKSQRVSWLSPDQIRAAALSGKTTPVRRLKRGAGYAAAYETAAAIAAELDTPRLIVLQRSVEQAEERRRQRRNRRILAILAALGGAVAALFTITH